MYNFILLAIFLLYSFNYCDMVQGKAFDPIFLASALKNNYKQFQNVNEAQNGTSVTNNNTQAEAEESLRNLLSKPMEEIDNKDLLQTLWDALTLEEIVSIFGHQQFTSSSSAFSLSMPNFDVEITKPKLAPFNQNYHHHQNSGKDFERNQIPHLSSNILIYLEGFGRQFNLNVYPNQNLLDPNFFHLHRHKDHSVIIEPHLAQKELGCFYHGSASHQNYSSDEQEGVVALSLCGGMKGFILPTVGDSHNNSHYVIHPLPNRLLTLADRENNASSCSIDMVKEVHERHHIIFRRQGVPFHKQEPKISKVAIELTVAQGNILKDQKERMKRDNGVFVDKRKSPLYSKKDWTNIFIDINRIGLKSISTVKRGTPTKTVETAVFIDKDLFKQMQQNFPEDTQTEITRIVLSMINGLQLLYKDPSLGHRIDFILKRLEILESDPPSLIRTYDVDGFLHSFCIWQESVNSGSEADPLHWDHAVMMTGLDFYEVQPGRINNQVVGHSPVAGMCTRSASCTVTEGQNLETIFTVAHELGHNLGMGHDGSAAGNTCDQTSYIMSPTASSGKSSWSDCSKTYLERFLRSEQAKCLFDESTPEISLENESDRRLPGEILDANRQCKLNFGHVSFHATRQPLEDVCRELKCLREYFIWTAPPALEGTKCAAADDMWCRAGICVPKITDQPPPSTNLDLGRNNSQNIASSGCSFGTQSLAIVYHMTSVLNIIILVLPFE